MIWVRPLITMAAKSERSAESRKARLDRRPTADALQQRRALLLNVRERPRPGRIMPGAREDDILQHAMRRARAGARVRIMAAQRRRQCERDLAKGRLCRTAIGDQGRTLLPAHQRSRHDDVPPIPGAADRKKTAREDDVRKALRID